MTCLFLFQNWLWYYSASSNLKTSLLKKLEKSVNKHQNIACVNLKKFYIQKSTFLILDIDTLLWLLKDKKHVSDWCFEIFKF